MNDLKEMQNSKYKVILLDIFDTIVSRKVQPEYTKKIWANHITKRFNLNLNMQDLYVKRNKIETELGEDAAREGKDWEFRYIDMLKEIYEYLSLKISFNEFKHIATQIEIDIESAALVPDKKMITEIKKAKKKGKKIYCVSDMYLSKKMLEEIFANLNIIDLFDDLFVSCEYYENKKSGKLFDRVLEKINELPENCLMLGDNYSSDYETPKSKNIAAVHLNREKNYQAYEKFIEENNENKILEKFRNLANTPTDNFEHSIFTLYKFTEKLYYSLLNDGLDEVFFLSREGEYLKKLFDTFMENIAGKKIKSHYILVSRKATYLPSLRPLDREDFSGLLQQYVYISLKEFLGSLNFTKEDIAEVLEDYSTECKQILKTKSKGLKEEEKKELQALGNKEWDTKIIYLYGSKVLTYLKANKKFKKIYEINRVEQNTLFKKYIKQFTTSKKICVVDIGWNGSIQENIQNILGKDYSVTGYLYGFVSRDINKSKNKTGLIFSNIPDETANFPLFFENRTVFEILLGASHGSANKYVEKNNKIEVSTFEKEEEKRIYNNVISKIQDTMFELYEELLKLLPNSYYNNIELDKEINRIHFKMVFEPTKEQLQFFNKIYHYENFGVFEFSKFNLKKKLNLGYYLKENVKYFVKYKSFFYDAFWPTLKLYNERLYLQRFLYKMTKKIRLKKRGII